MASVFKPMRTVTDANGKRRKKPYACWYVRYVDADGVQRKRKGYTDKAATLQLAAKLEREVAQRASGMIDKFSDQRKRPLAEHLSDWHRSLLDKGTTRKQADLVKARADRALKDCGFSRWTDITASRVQSFIGGLRGAGLSAQTRNFYLRAVKQFCLWIVMDQRAESNPLQHLSGENVKADRRHDRAALSVDQLRRLLSSTHDGPAWRGIPGPERALIYRLVTETGLRANEVRTVRVGSFSLDATAPSVTVEAGYSKHRQEDTLPLRSDLAKALQRHFSGKLANALAFRMPGRYDTARMIRFDLARAGIPYRDDAGRVRDYPRPSPHVRHPAHAGRGSPQKRPGANATRQHRPHDGPLHVLRDRRPHSGSADATRLLTRFGSGIAAAGDRDAGRGIL